MTVGRGHAEEESLTVSPSLALASRGGAFSLSLSPSTSVSDETAKEEPGDVDAPGDTRPSAFPEADPKVEAVQPLDGTAVTPVPPTPHELPGESCEATVEASEVGLITAFEHDSNSVSSRRRGTTEGRGESNGMLSPPRSKPSASRPNSSKTSTPLAGVKFAGRLRCLSPPHPSCRKPTGGLPSTGVRAPRAPGMEAPLRNTPFPALPKPMAAAPTQLRCSGDPMLAQAPTAPQASAPLLLRAARPSNAVAAGATAIPTLPPRGAGARRAAVEKNPAAWEALKLGLLGGSQSIMMQRA
mmetsp:Transcript_94133/g.265825  ORF Transcript_94133/g.265825 Transcript_94133/m.265825 type:complete len:298 (+) Transcript_94133:497-1390(+)